MVIYEIIIKAGQFLLSGFFYSILFKQYALSHKAYV